MNENTPTRRASPEDLLAYQGLVAGQTVFDRYLLEAFVGRGGMGVVWRTRDQKLERPTALKFLLPAVAAEPEAVRDLKLETKRCLELTHANIVRVHDFVEQPGVAAIAMEYVDGVNLGKLKMEAPGGCLSAAELAPLATQLCAALDYAHRAAQVVHHDLKPANILVTRDGHLKVTDFGIARSLTESHTRVTGLAASTGGTVHYMSPQQLAGDKPTALDDVYALGATLYEMLTGKPPFYRGDAFSLMKQLMDRVPAPLEQHRLDAGCHGADIPSDWSNTILACLAKSPEERPQSAAEVAYRLGLGPAIEPAPTSPGGTGPPAKTGASPPPPGHTAGSMAGPPTLAGAATAAPAPPQSTRTWWPVLTALLLAVACLGYYTVIYLPRQAQREAAARMLAEKTRTEKDQADLRSFAAILATVDALARGAPEAQEQATAAAVRDYLAKAAEPYRTDVAGAWEKRRSAWEDFTSAHRTGSLVVETDPPGATVTLLPNGETKKSPAAFNDLKPGKVTLRVELEGYEPQVVPFAIKPGFAGKIDPVRLTAIFGSIAFTSEPNDLPVVVVGNGRTLKGRTPFDAAKLPPGTYRANFAREGWRPQEKSVTITGGARAAVFADLKGFSLHLESTPAGAQILLDQRAVGVAPLTLTGLEPRDYQVAATLEGYINYGQITRLTANASLTLTLQPKPVTRLLQKLAGHTWRMDANWGFAELHFDLQGLIHGTHMVRTAGAAIDQGRVDSGNAINNVLLAKFAPAQAPPFYSGEVRIRIIDDNSLGVSWQLNRTVISYTFRRRD